MKRFFSLKSTPVAAALLAAAVATGCTMKSQEAPPLTGPSEYRHGHHRSPPRLMRSRGMVRPSRSSPSRRSTRTAGRCATCRSGPSCLTQTDPGWISIAVGEEHRHGRERPRDARLYRTAGAQWAIGRQPHHHRERRGDSPGDANFDNETPRLTTIRLVPPGIVVPPDGLVPRFTVSPNTPTDHQDVFFDASTEHVAGEQPDRALYVGFRGRNSGSGRQQTHRYDNAGLYRVTLTITDGFGRSAQTSNNVSVSAGTAPTAVFVFSPLIPHQNQSISFNASASTAGVPGRHIRSYTWDFGDGSPDEYDGQRDHEPYLHQGRDVPRDVSRYRQRRTSSRGATTDVPVIP